MKKCPCNCHDPEARKAMRMRKHKNCRLCRKALKSEADWLRLRESTMKATKR